MAGGSYELELLTDRGGRLALIDDWLEIKYTLVEMEVGNVTVTLPSDFDLDLIQEDYKFAVWRRYPGGPRRLEQVGIIAAWKYWTDTNGVDHAQVKGLDGNWLLKRRFVKYSQTIEDYADDMIKTVVTTNLSTYNPPRGIPSGNFSVEADKSQGVSFKKSFPWRNILEVCQSMLKTSMARDPSKPIYFHTVPISGAQWEFRTFLGQIGADKRWPGGTNPIVVSIDNNNMGEAVYSWDATEEISLCYCGAGNVNSFNAIMENTLRSRISIFGYKEDFIVASDPHNYAAEQAEAQEVVEDNVPKESFYCTIKDNENQRYGRDWNFGDRMTAFYRGKHYDVRVVGVTVTVTQDSEDIKGALAIPMTTNIQAG